MSDENSKLNGESIDVSNTTNDDELNILSKLLEREREIDEVRSTKCINKTLE